MAFILFIFGFVVSCLVLSWLSSRLVDSLVSVAHYLKWREFIIAFFLLAFAASLPNFFVDLTAVFHGIPQLAFGDIIGGNFIDLTLVMAIAIFFARGSISTKSEMVQHSAIFTAVIAALPLFVILDGHLGRLDGVILIGAFVAYSVWIFSKKERFRKNYRSSGVGPRIITIKDLLFNLGKVAIFLVLLVLASQIIIHSAEFFSQQLGISIGMVGILIVGLGNCFPETYFAVISARNKENWMVLGDMMGSVIVCATLVLGIIALIYPFAITDFSPFFIAEIFLIIGSIAALLFIRTGSKVTKREGLLLLLIYVFWVLLEIFKNNFHIF
jgi:cation:H+ antiporter